MLIPVVVKVKRKTAELNLKNLFHCDLGEFYLLIQLLGSVERIIELRADPARLEAY